MTRLLFSKYIVTVIIAIVVFSCKSKQAVVSKKKTSTPTQINKSINPKAAKIVTYAKTFNGTRYKFGGNTKRGIDCSGLIHRAFNDNNVSVPRTTATLSKHGNWVDIKAIEVGDLIFFATKKNSRTINHVGIVTYANAGNVKFIHASSSKGVMESSLANRYWYFAYVQTRRVL